MNDPKDVKSEALNIELYSASLMFAICLSCNAIDGIFGARAK